MFDRFIQSPALVRAVPLEEIVQPDYIDLDKAFMFIGAQLRERMA